MTTRARVSTLETMTTPPPPSGKTPIRTIRVSDDLWAKAMAKAADNDEKISEIFRDFLADYVEGRQPGYTSGWEAGRRELMNRLAERVGDREAER